MKIFCYLICFLLSFSVAWNAWTYTNHEEFLSRVCDAQANVDAIADAQDYAGPLVALSEQLASENAMFTQVVDRARDTVTAKELELVQTREALNSAIELLQEQIVENNQCVDEIRDLEDQIMKLSRTVEFLMTKIPNAFDYPYDPAYNN